MTPDTFVLSTDTISEIIDDVTKLHEHKLVDDTVKDRAKSMKLSLILDKDNMPSTGVPI